MGRLNFQFSNNVDNDDVHFHVKWGLWCDIKPCSRHDQKIRYFGLKRNFLLHNWTIVILLIAKPCLQAYPASRVKGSFKSCSWFAWKWRQNFNQFFALLLRSAKNSLKTISLQTGCCWVELSLACTQLWLNLSGPEEEIIHNISQEKSVSDNKPVQYWGFSVNFCHLQKSCNSAQKSCWNA